MIRRLTIICGLLTLAVVAVLTVHDHARFGGGPSHRGAASVTAIPDRPAYWPPVKPLLPAPLRHGTAQARPTVIQGLGAIARTLLNLPKILDHHTRVNPTR